MAGKKLLDMALDAARAAMPPRPIAKNYGSFSGTKLPDAEKLARLQDKFIYHSSTADQLENMKYGLDPQHGPLISEMAKHAGDIHPNELLEQSVPLVWMSDTPSWVSMKVGRKLNKPAADVTQAEIMEHGHLAMIPKKGDYAENVWKVGDEGLSSGEYSPVTNLKGETKKAGWTDLYENDYTGNKSPFGVETNEYISAQPVEPMFNLTGQDLIDFLNATGRAGKYHGGMIREHHAGEANMDRDFIERALRLARGGYADGGDADIQSNSMPVFSDGQVNWGNSDSAADFARADAALRAMQAMRSAPAAPEPQAAPMPAPRPAPRPAPYSAPRDVPLPPVRPANLGQPVFQNSIPEGPGAYIPGDGFPDRPPGQQGDPGMLFDPDMMSRGFTPPMSSPQPAPAPSVSMGYSDVSPFLAPSALKAPSFGAMENITPGAPEWPRVPSRPAEGKFTNRVMPLTPPPAPQPSTDELLSLLPTPPKPVASAAIDKAAPPRAVPNMTPQQRDLIIRTIAAEASGKSPEEAQAIGHVIMNRITSGRYGKTPEKVLFAPNQFEPWKDPRGSNYPMRHKPGSAKYEKAQAALDAALAKDDITGGATLFWGPKAQAALGRPAPKWGRTGGLDIGETRFHREEGGAVEEREGHGKGSRVISKMIGATKSEAELAAEAAKAAKEAARAKQLGRVEQYTDAPTKRLTDWQWRPMTDVARDLDLQEIPPHVQAFGDFMRSMSDKAAKEGLSARDLIKGYTTTRASIQRRSQDADRLRALGLDLPPDIKTIRPEGAWSEWLMTPEGKRYLDEAVKGNVSGDSADSAMKIMQPFGKQNEVPAFMDWAATHLPGREQAASDLVARAAQGGSSPQEWRNFTADIRGVGPSKSGFLASLYGRGDQPTLDARQIKMNTGNPSKEASKYIARGYGEGGVEAVDRLAARQSALGLEAPSQYDPFYQHLAHHSIWDKAANEVNTHGDIIRAMQEADGGAVVERALHLARGGYATQGGVDGQPDEEYPDGARPLTIYRGERPDAAAGPVDTRGPTSHARYQAGLGQLGRFEDVPPMDPAVMGENWANAVQGFRNRPINPDEPAMTSRTPSGRERLYDAIIGSPENGTVQNNRANIAGFLAGSQGTGIGVLDFAPFIGQALNATDMAHSVSEGDYVGAGVSGAMMAAAPFAGKLIKPAVNLGRKAVDLAKSVSDDTLNYLVPRAMGTAGAAGILAPGDAEAANISKLTKLFPNFSLSGKPTNRVGSQLQALDPRLAQSPPKLSSFKSGVPFSEMSVGYEKVPGYLDPHKAIPFDKLEGMYAAPLLSDLTGGGNVITHVGGKKLSQPVLIEAGGDFPRGPAGRGVTPAGWASMAPNAQTYMTHLSKRVPEGERAVGLHTTMFPTGGDSSDMMVETLMRQMPKYKITKQAAADFDNEMKSYFPNWPGIKNYDKTEEFLKTLPFSQRSLLAQGMDKAGYAKLGFPDIGQTRFAITEPRLMSTPHLGVGYSVAELNPRGGLVKNPEYAHSNYTGSMEAPLTGGYLGGLESAVHASDIWSDWWKSLAASARDPKNKPQAQRALLTRFPVQKIDAEMVDRVMKKQEEHKRIFGWRRGGVVSER